MESPVVSVLFDCIADDPSIAHKAYKGGHYPDISRDKPLVVFSSHAHHDHYGEKIWKLRNISSNVKYVLSSDIRIGRRDRERLGITDLPDDAVVRVEENENISIDFPGLCVDVETFKSTDEGVGFFVTCEGVRIFHPGDLNLWTWSGEGEAYVRQMRRNFEKYTEPLKGRECDIAFALLDPRLEENAYEGIDAFNSMMTIKYLFPIHMWRQYDLIEKYMCDRKNTSNIERITRENQTFMLEI